jgi:hypothetical protein
MDVARIADKESAPHPEFVGNAMVDAIGRKPIYRRHFDIKKGLDVGADVFKTEEFVAMSQFRRYEADQTLHSTRPHREHQREDVFAEVDVQIPGKAACDLHVCDIEELLMGAARKTEMESFAHTATRAITAAGVHAFRFFNAPCIVLDRSSNAVFTLPKVR